MEAFDTVSRPPREASGSRPPQPAPLRFIPDRAQYTIYALALAASICIWFIAIRSPLWLDETVSIFLIKGGFAGIRARQVWPDSPTY